MRKTYHMFSLVVSNNISLRLAHCFIIFKRVHFSRFGKSLQSFCWQRKYLNILTHKVYFTSKLVG